MNATHGITSAAMLGWHAALHLALALLLLGGCQSMGQDAWRAPLLRDHPLVGQIREVQTGQVLTEEDFLRRLDGSRVVLLGETHDNEDHHRIQTRVLQALVANGQRPALVMEQFDTEYQPAIDGVLALPNATSETIAEAGRLNRRGWNWLFYEPLVAMALNQRLPIVAANLARTAARRVVSGGTQSLGEDRVKRLALDRTWNEERDATMRREIIDGHCGQVSPDLLPGLVAAQRARDAVMADALVSALDNGASGAVAIVGRGHARKDIGVPIYLAARLPEARATSIALVEVTQGRVRLPDYVGPGDDCRAFDFVWFTPRAERKDPCEGFSLPAPK